MNVFSKYEKLFANTGYSIQHVSVLDDSTVHAILVFSPQNVGHEQDQACRQSSDDTLMDGKDILQCVDPLLHGTGMEVVVDACSDAPNCPDCVY